MDYNEFLKLSSFPLRQIDNQNKPINLASGSLIDYCKKRILLTVSHATGNNGNWSIELEYVKGKGCKLYQIGAMNYILKGIINSENIKNTKDLFDNLKEVDFSYALVPEDIIPFYQEITITESILISQPRLVIQTDFSITPTIDEFYGFSGQIQPEFIDDKYLTIKNKIYAGLKYLKTEDDYYVFKLPFKHPGHKYFEGCSGAPVFDSKRNLVGLVCSGNSTDDTIYAISLNKFKMMLDILVSNN